MKSVLSIVMTAVFFLIIFAGCTPRTDIPGGENTPTTVPTTAVPTAGAPTDPVAPAVDPAPLMWKVTGEGSGALYLFGTIHVGDEGTGTVLEKVTDTLASCDALAVEFDTVAYEKDALRVSRDIQRFVYTDGSTVKDHMPENIYKAAKTLMSRAGISSAYLDMYNPAMWSMFVEQAAVQVYSKLKPEQGMDTLLILRAYDLSVPVWDVESAELQYGLMNEFSDELYCLMMRQTMKMGKKYGEQLDALYAAWLAGDLEALMGEIDGEEEEEEELNERQIALIAEYNEVMLDNRNLGMAEKAKEYLKTGKTVFFAVGAAHMLGEAGVVRLLEDAGYTVEQFNV